MPTRVLATITITIIFQSGSPSVRTPPDYYYYNISAAAGRTFCSLFARSSSPRGVPDRVVWPRRCRNNDRAIFDFFFRFFFILIGKRTSIFFFFLSFVVVLSSRDKTGRVSTAGSNADKYIVVVQVVSHDGPINRSLRHVITKRLVRREEMRPYIV